MKNFLSLTLPHSRMCIRIYIFNFKKQTNKQKKQTRIQTSKKNKQEYKQARKTNKNTKKAKKVKEEKRMSPENG